MGVKFFTNRNQQLLHENFKWDDSLIITLQHSQHLEVQFKSEGRQREAEFYCWENLLEGARENCLVISNNEELVEMVKEKRSNAFLSQQSGSTKARFAVG